MSIVLSICIPTYNRAVKLKKQVDAVCKSMGAYANRCEIIIADNHSSDQTAAAIDQLKKDYPNQITSYQQKVNIGFVENYRFLIQQATGTYTWVLGDDDAIYETYIERFFIALSEHSNSVGLFHFNHRCVLESNEMVLEHFYSIHENVFFKNGRDVFESLANNNDLGGLMFISASIFYSKYAKDALVKWKGSKQNQAFPLFVAAYASSQHGCYFIAQNQLDCTYGESFWKDQYIQIQLHDVIEILSTLKGLKYSRGFIVKQIRAVFSKKIGWQRTRHLLARRPLYMLHIGALILKGAL